MTSLIRIVKWLVLIIVYIITNCNNLIHAQRVINTEYNNLVHPPNYQGCEIGTLGKVSKYGKKRKQALIIISGMGFGEAAYNSLIQAFQKKYTVYMVTPAGFGNSIAPVMPDTSTKYTNLPWTNGIANGILNLIEHDKLRRPHILAHFASSTQAAFELAINYNEKIGKVVVISGAPYRYYPTPKDKEWKEVDWATELKLSPERRSFYTESWVAPKWFKTINREFFDSNNWTADDYCKNTAQGELLVNEAAQVPLPTIIRYMIEWGAYDAVTKYQKIESPMLVLIPDFEGVLNPPKSETLACRNAEAKKYLNYYHKDIWNTAKEVNNKHIRFETIPDSRIFMWIDQPKKVVHEINKFLANYTTPKITSGILIHK